MVFCGHVQISSVKRHDPQRATGNKWQCLLPEMLNLVELYQQENASFLKIQGMG